MHLVNELLKNIQVNIPGQGQNYFSKVYTLCCAVYWLNGRALSYHRGVSVAPFCAFCRRD